jgi:hypothetical protein
VLHPLALLAVVVLVVNDWVLKRVMPGALTGKLSDIAGLVFAPLALSSLVGLVTRRRPSRARILACITAVGGVFGATKLFPAVAHAVASVGFHAHIVADPTDLFCLPALAVAYWISASDARAAASPARGPDRPSPRS